MTAFFAENLFWLKNPSGLARPFFTETEAASADRRCSTASVLILHDGPYFFLPHPQPQDLPLFLAASFFASDFAGFFSAMRILPFIGMNLRTIPE